MPLLNHIYQEKLLAYAADIARDGRLKSPDASATVVSRSCGSRITVDLIMEGDVIIDFGQTVEACALGSASASIFGGIVLGKRLSDIRSVRNCMFSMLKQNGPSPDAEWAEMRLLEPARDFTNRHQSILLVFNAVLKAAKNLAD